MTPPKIPNVNKIVAGSTAIAAGGIHAAASSAATSIRMAALSEQLLEETVMTMRAARPVIKAVADVIEAGLLEDVAKIAATASSTQDDIRAAREAAERIVTIVNAAIDGVGGAPGAQMVLKGISRIAGVPKLPNPVAVVKAPAKAATPKKAAPKKHASSAASRKLAPK